MALKSCFKIAFILGLVLLCTNAEGKVFNVVSYGAKADAVTDNSKPFLDTWTDACKWNGKVTLLIPLGVYMVHAVNFIGPCKGSTFTFQIKGIIKAPTDPKLFCSKSWISFRYVNRIEIKGGGAFNGEGVYAWGKGQCPTTGLPSTLTFDFINNAVVHNIRSINSKGVHFDVFKCNDVRFSHINITAPGDSPNTDGMRIGFSTNIQVLDSNIGTGDDCIAIIAGSKSINVSGVTCGPGHGISIGSLGNTPNPVVKDIHVKSCTLTATQNGVRIKTRAPSNAGIATMITFEDIIMNNVWNPIFIDQHYCAPDDCSTQTSSVQVKDVTYNNIRGTSSSVAAVTFNCSAKFPCQGIKLHDINLSYNDPGGPAISICANARGTPTGKELPPSCLKPSLSFTNRGLLEF